MTWKNRWLMVRAYLSGRPKGPGIAPALLQARGKRTAMYGKTHLRWNPDEFTDEEIDAIKKELGKIREAMPLPEKTVMLSLSRAPIFSGTKRYRGLYRGDVGYIQWRDALFVKKEEIAAHEIAHCLGETYEHVGPWF